MSEVTELSKVKCLHGFALSVYNYQQMWTTGTPKKPTKLQKFILKRDNFRCVLCGSTFHILVDHIDNDKRHECPFNLQTLCRSCNKRKNPGRRGPNKPMTRGATIQELWGLRRK